MAWLDRGIKEITNNFSNARIEVGSLLIMIFFWAATFYLSLLSQKKKLNIIKKI